MVLRRVIPLATIDVCAQKMRKSTMTEVDARNFRSLLDEPCACYPIGMVTRVEALNYRCLRYVSRAVNGINVLVGPNASGKTTFIDVIAFLGDLVRDGFDFAVETRTRNWNDLLWMRKGDGFQLALEVKIPEKIQAKLGEGNKYQFARFEVGIGNLDGAEGPGIVHEKFYLRTAETTPPPRSPACFRPRGNPPKISGRRNARINGRSSARVRLEMTPSTPRPRLREAKDGYPRSSLAP